MFTSCIIMVQCLRLREWHCSNTTEQAVVVQSLPFFLLFLFVPAPDSGCHIVFSVVFPHSSPIGESSSAFPYLLWPWHFWNILVRYFVECPPTWAYLMFSFRLRSTFGSQTKDFGEESHWSDVILSMYWIGGTSYCKVLLLVMSSLIPWLFMIVSAWFLHCKVTLPF